MIKRKLLALLCQHKVLTYLQIKDTLSEYSNEKIHAAVEELISDGKARLEVIPHIKLHKV